MKKYILKQNNITKLKNKKLFILDMDGTIYKDNILFDGVKELLDKIKQSKLNYLFLTNNSSRSVTDYVKKLNKFGLNTKKEDFFTSTQATVDYIKNKLDYKNEYIYAMGTNAFINELKEANLNITNDIEKDIKIVLVGYDTELNYKKLEDVSYLLTKDVKFIATHSDLVCPVSFGFVPDCGLICEMLSNTTNRQPIFIGKPNVEIINSVLKKMNCTKEETIIIGDRLYTDIAAGINSEIDTICVLTGESTVEMIEKSQYKPTYILDSIKELHKIFDSK